MAKYDGNDMALFFKGVRIANLIDVDIPENLSEYDASNAGEEYMDFVPGKTDATVTANFNDDTDEAAYDVCKPGNAEGSLVFYPQGYTSGKPVRTATAFVTSRNRPEAHNNVVVTTVSFRIRGTGWTDATVGAS